MNKKTLKGRESLNKYLEISGKFYALTDYKSYHEKMDFQCSKCQYIFTHDVLQMDHLGGRL